MKILKLSKPVQSPVAQPKKQDNDIVQNNHSIRTELEKKGFAAMAGTYVHSKINRKACEDTIRSFTKIRNGTPVWVVIEGDKGSYLAKGTQDGEKLAVDGKAFNYACLPKAFVSVCTNLRAVGRKITRFKNLTIEIRRKGQEARTISGIGSLDPKLNYGFIIEGTEVFNFELKSNKYNAKKVAKLVSCK